jgi:hypothetical protein
MHLDAQKLEHASMFRSYTMFATHLPWLRHHKDRNSDKLGALVRKVEEITRNVEEITRNLPVHNVVSAKKKLMKSRYSRLSQWDIRSLKVFHNVLTRFPAIEVDCAVITCPTRIILNRMNIIDGSFLLFSKDSPIGFSVSDQGMRYL